ncbi:MAG: lysylphosphatidylglycerol synthase domain-containing protein [Polyangiaceae bacterium]
MPTDAEPATPPVTEPVALPIAGPPRPKQRAWQWAVHALLAVGGAAALALLVRHAGVDRLREAVLAAAPVMPVVILLEGLRIGTESWGTRLLYGEAARRVPLGVLLHAHLASYAPNLVLPAGRLAAEALRATWLAPWVGGATAAAAASAKQSISLMGTFLLSLPIIPVAFLQWGRSGMAIAIAVQACTAIGLAMTLQLASRRPELARWAGRFSPRAAAALSAFHTAVHAHPLFPPAPIAVATLGRCLQLSQLALLAWGAGAGLGLRPALLVTGVYLVGTAAGDLVPAQVGVTDGAFVLAADALRIPLAAALSIPLLVHAGQIGWAAVGLVALVVRPRHRP